MAGASVQGKVRRLVTLGGVVQGVGFRPWAFSLARRLDIRGSIRNNTTGVEMDLEGSKENLEEFLRELKAYPPPLAKIDFMIITALCPEGYEAFVIGGSSQAGRGFTQVSPDIATCGDCLRELWDPSDRRYMYPFINCTHCGPRFTVIEDIPYDRPKTSMKHFPLCPACHREYTDIKDRRFHAQPVACGDCGPVMSFVDTEGALLHGDVLEKAVELLRQGEILAVKGIGGYHLAVDARDEEAVKRLRRRKHRYDKPLAIMMATVAEIKRYCEVNQGEREMLEDPGAPIVLLKKSEDGTSLAPSLTQGLNTLGVMLPYSPLHHILINGAGFPLVMTSGNLSDEPLCKNEDEARERLGEVANGFLIHNRQIINRIDDTVCFYAAGDMRMVRRARGFAPQPFIIKGKSKPILATGAAYKNTFCLTKDQYAFVSHHLGDLDNPRTYTYYIEEIEKYKRLFRVEPEYVAKDLHPGYLSGRYAREQSLPILAVQHHHAHIASVMAEYGLEDKVLGIAYDGTGLGSDGNIWGAEFLLADLAGFERLGHLAYFPLPGGDLGVKNPFRTALGLIHRNTERFSEYIARFDAAQVEMILKQIENEVNAPKVSSMGRLFDAVASMIGLRDVAAYEGQAAMELESILTPMEETYLYDIQNSASAFEIKVDKLLEGLHGDYVAGVSRGNISAKFHNTVISFTVDMARRIRGAYGVNKTVLAGGCFQNRYLLEGLHRELQREGFEIYIPSRIPINDGGISLGQAAIASKYFSTEDGRR